MIGKIFRIYGTIAKVVNYDDTSGLYIYALYGQPASGYISKEYILEHEVTDNG